MDSLAMRKKCGKQIDSCWRQLIDRTKQSRVRAEYKRAAHSKQKRNQDPTAVNQRVVTSKKCLKKKTKFGRPMEGTQVQPGEAKGALAAGLKTVEEMQGNKSMRATSTVDLEKSQKGERVVTTKFENRFFH
jgi:hypothetical protein